MNTVPQLPLDIRLREEACFGRFRTGANAALVTSLQEWLALPQRRQNLFVWGVPGSGKSHLLQAVCREAAEQDLGCAYVPLDGSLPVAPALLEGLGRYPLVVLDDLHCVLPRAGWPEALFRLFNESQDAGGSLLVSARSAPRALDVPLADLTTRLSRCIVMEVAPLEGDAALDLFCERAAERGLEVSAEVHGFLLRRAPRSLPALLNLLDQLDRAALAAQRQLSIPFIKQALGW